MENLREFWTKEEWMPTSPDLSPLDNWAWNHILQRACLVSHPSKASLMASVNSEWSKMPVETIKKACSVERFKKKLKQCIDAKGGVFEK